MTRWLPGLVGDLCWRPATRRGFEGDGVAERFELADQVVLAGLGVVAAGEVVFTEVLVVAALVEHVPGDDQDAVPDGEHRAGLTLLPEGAQQMSILGG